MASQIRERALWQGQVVTVLNRGLNGVEIRDGFGVTHNVRKRDVQELREDDERKRFRAPQVSE